MSKPQSRGVDTSSLAFNIKEMMLAYPSIFQTEERAINHLYLVIGNGYEWVDGALNNIFSNSEKAIVRKMLIEGKPKSAIRKRILAIDKKRWIADHGKKFARRYLTKIAKEKLEPIKTYPICEYSFVIDIPPDARPDWVAGAYRAAILALLYGKDTNNLSWVIKAVEGLDRKFGCLRRPSGGQNGRV